MSLFDKVIAAVTPPESEEKRQQVRAAAQALSGADDWLGLALQHHLEIERLFDAAKAAGDASLRLAAAKRLSVFLTAHANAEESVLYPMVAQDHKGHAAMAYQEQAMTKVELAWLERIEPMSQDWIDKLDHIRGAVLHHMYEEEGTWFPELFRQAGASGQPVLTHRFREEFERMNQGSPAAGG